VRKVGIFAEICLTPAGKTKISGAMSGHGDPHDEAHGDGHDEEEHDDHPAPPVLEEPATPLWLTILGIGLFLVAGILFVATREDGKTTAQLTVVPEGTASAAAPAAPAPNPAGAGNPPPNQPARLNAAPNPPGAPGAARPGGGSQRPGHEGHDHD
jgi:hypothetical protein